MKEECKHFKHYKAIFSPRCNCKACWFKYFETHHHRVQAAKSVISTSSDARLEEIVGIRWATFFKLYLQETKA